MHFSGAPWQAKCRSSAFSNGFTGLRLSLTTDLPLQAKLLLAVPRVRGHSPKATLVERYVLDSLGRIIDPGPARHKTIESVHLLAEVLLTRNQLELENAAALAFCNTKCFTHSGPHVFTPGCTGKMAIDTHTLHRSVSFTRELSLGELLLLNAIRLRMRTLPYSNIADHAVPMLTEDPALPRISARPDQRYTCEHLNEPSMIH